MKPPTEPFVTRKTLINAVILAALILAGVVLFLILGRHPVPLLESSLLISR
jgi:hypothetical protein